MDSVAVTAALPAVGYPIRRSSDQSLFSGSSKLIAASHVLHRLLAPRHPPSALISLTKISLPAAPPASWRHRMMHKTRHFALDLEKDIRLSMTTGSKTGTGLNIVMTCSSSSSSSSLRLKDMGAKIQMADSPFFTCRPILFHVLNPATRVDCGHCINISMQFRHE